MKFVCFIDYDLALAMGLHPRLGKESPVAMLLGTITADLLMKFFCFI